MILKCIVDNFHSNIIYLSIYLTIATLEQNCSKIFKGVDKKKDHFE